MISQVQDYTSVPKTALPGKVAGSATRRIRILHVVSRLGLGGTEHGVLKLLRGLASEEFEHFICAVRGIDSAFAERVSPGVKVYSVGDSKPGFRFPLLRLARLMRELRPHIVHSRNFGALDAIPAARLAGVPVAIHSEHGYELEFVAGLPLRRRLVCRAVFPMADALLAVTQELRKFHSHQSWMKEDRFRVIYNGVDTQRFFPRGEAVRRRGVQGVPADRIVIGSIGRLVAIKDHRTLLKAAERLLSKEKDIHVLIVGTGPELENLQTYSRQSDLLKDRVSFAGSSDNVPELLSAMDIFVLPSICEGLSNTILEAMASGVPVIAGRAGGNPEIISEEHYGMLFTPRDDAGLAEQIAQLADNAQLRTALGTAGRNHIIQNFSLAGMIVQYRRLYFELAAQREIWKGN